jgi:hypothetical protein
MPQQFLHAFEFRAHASQQRRIANLAGTDRGVTQVSAEIPGGEIRNHTLIRRLSQAELKLRTQ